jgi:quercetin dioxygenase-like cupin family protein
MNIVALEEGQEIFNQQGAIGKKLLTATYLEVVYLTIETHGTIAPHALPYPVIFYVLEGSGTLAADDTVFPVTTGSTIECPPEVQRGWENSSATPLKLLVMKCIC